MTIADAITALKRLERQYGGDTLVYFDCPTCQQAFTPGFVQAQRAVVLPREPKTPED